MSTPLAVTWWGHSSTTVELDGVRVATDPVLVDRLWHLRRHTLTPPPTSLDTDVVLVSHLHTDHLHEPSLVRFAADVPIVVPRGAAKLLPRLDRSRVLEVAPGETIEVAGLHVEILPAHHDGRRFPWLRHEAPAIGFRVAGPTHAFWFPGDTGMRDGFTDVASVDLALVPIGGWGPSLGPEHLDPAEAVVATEQVGARWTMPVHYGTFWPLGLERIRPASHRHFFDSPPVRFAELAEGHDVGTLVIAPPGERHVLVP
ncbi:MBL fold metallo-hydrolase [soil metagenome]